MAYFNHECICHHTGNLGIDLHNDNYSILQGDTETVDKQSQPSTKKGRIGKDGYDTLQHHATDEILAVRPTVAANSQDSRPRRPNTIVPSNGQNLNTRLRNINTQPEITIRELTKDPLAHRPDEGKEVPSYASDLSKGNINDSGILSNTPGDLADENFLIKTKASPAYNIPRHLAEVTTTTCSAYRPKAESMDLASKWRSSASTLPHVMPIYRAAKSRPTSMPIHLEPLDIQIRQLSSYPSHSNDSDDDTEFSLDTAPDLPDKIKGDSPNGGVNDSGIPSPDFGGEQSPQGRDQSISPGGEQIIPGGGKEYSLRDKALGKEYSLGDQTLPGGGNEYYLRDQTLQRGGKEYSPTALIKTDTCLAYNVHHPEYTTASLSGPTTESTPFMSTWRDHTLTSGVQT
jgi:hypothetical protein